MVNPPLNRYKTLNRSKTHLKTQELPITRNVIMGGSHPGDSGVICVLQVVSVEVGVGGRVIPAQAGMVGTLLSAS